MLAGLELSGAAKVIALLCRIRQGDIDVFVEEDIKGAFINSKIMKKLILILAILFLNIGLVHAQTNDIIDYVATDNEVQYTLIKNQTLQYENEISRTPNSYTIDLGNGQKATKIFTGKPFYYDVAKNIWYDTAIATTTIDDFNNYLREQDISFFDKLINKAQADNISSYASSGDGICYISNASWDTAHDAAESAGNDDTGDSGYPQAGKFSSDYYLRRMFFPFDTSAIPDDSEIESASMFIYITDQENGDSDDIHVVESSQNSVLALENTDYNNIGASSGGSIDTTTITTSQYNEIELNATGLTFIKTETESASCGGETGYTCLVAIYGNDLNDSAPAGQNYATIRTSEYAGTDYDPYLYVVYSEGGEPPEDPPVATSTASTAIGVSLATALNIIWFTFIFTFIFALTLAIIPGIKI